MLRERISQTEAARLRGVTRQRISELVANGRLSKPPEGGVYEDEVRSLIIVKRGRPYLTEKEREVRGIGLFEIGDKVNWNFFPRDAYGYSINLSGEVIKISAKRIKISFSDSNGKECTGWINKSVCKKS